jgi:hypothetical protein
VTRASAIAVVAGALGAVLLVAAMRQSFFGVMLGAMLSSLPLAMAVLGFGVNFLPVAVVSGAITVMVLTGSVALASVYLFMDAAPIALLSRLRGANENSPAISGAAIGQSVCWLVASATLILIAGLAFMPVGPEGIEATLREQLSEVLTTVTAATIMTPGGEVTAETREQMLKLLAGVLPAAVAVHWCLRAILSTGLAQIALAKMRLTRGPAPNYRQFAVPSWFVAPAGILIAMAWAGSGDVGYVSASAAAVLSLPLALQGLAVVHCAAAQSRQRLVLLVVFYILALLMASVAIMMLVMVGVVEQFYKIRARHFAARTGGE